MAIAIADFFIVEITSTSHIKEFLIKILIRNNISLQIGLGPLATVERLWNKVSKIEIVI